MKSKIFVFCNGCMPGWHNIEALTEDGCFIAGHICSDHGFASNDMGFTGDWKHKSYNRHYPDGWELLWVDAPKENVEFNNAYQRHIAWGADEYKKRMAVHAKDPETPQVEIEFSK